MWRNSRRNYIHASSFLTIRPNTERPVTNEIGSNSLLPLDQSQINSGSYKKGAVPENWDGNATDRIVEVINNFFK